MAKLNQVNDKQQPQAVTKNVLLKIRWATRFRELSAEIEQIITGNGALQMKSMPGVTHWFAQKEHVNWVWATLFGDPTADTAETDTELLVLILLVFSF